MATVPKMGAPLFCHLSFRFLVYNGVLSLPSNRFCRSARGCIGCEIESYTEYVVFHHMCYQPFVSSAMLSSQVRWKACFDVQSPIAMAEAPVSEWQFRYRGCDEGLRKWQFRYRGCDGRLRKWQFHYRGCDSRFAQETTLISQVADVFCSDFKPWFPIAKESLTPGRWRFTVCELILDGKTIVQIKM